MKNDTVKYTHYILLFLFMEAAGIIAGILIVLYGAFNVLFGLKFFRFLLPIAGFFLGVSTITVLGGYAGWSSAVTIAVAIVVGLIAALLAGVFWKLGLILAFGYIGYLIFNILLLAIGIHVPVIAIFGGVVTAVIFASVAMFTDIWKPLIIVATTLKGASMMIIGLAGVFFGFDHIIQVGDNSSDFFVIIGEATSGGVAPAGEWGVPPFVMAIFLILFAAVTISGIYYQLKTTEDVTLT